LYQDYEKSTQFTITVKDKTKAAILIYSLDSSKTIDFHQKAGVAIIRGEQNKHKEPSFQTVAARGIGGAKALRVELEPDYYWTCIPYAKVPELEDSEFILIVLTEEKTEVTITELPAWKHCEVAEGDWVAKSAGGPMDEPTFENNPRFELTLPKEDNVHFAIFLSQYENDPEYRKANGQDFKVVNEPYAL